MTQLLLTGDVRHVLGPCRRARHQECPQTFPGCGWDGRTARPAPAHVCACPCHGGAL